MKNLSKIPGTNLQAPEKRQTSSLIGASHLKLLWSSMLGCWMFAVSGLSQTNTPPPPPSLPAAPFLTLDFLTNLPTASSYPAATIGANVGVLLRNGAVENELKLDAYVHTNFMFSVALQNAPSSAVVDSLSVFGGYRKAWTSAEVYSQVLVRRTWSQNAGDRPSWQAGGALGASWLPMTGGHFSLGAEARLLTSPTGSALNTRPSGEFVVFTKIIF